ncbi:methyltransferase family protein [Maribacter halichondriae]|uniref:methyltransferase family protein n=1 Tax=Maribacter halichondriae TaxID=2980554 RepID=UPI003D30F09F
MVVFYKYTRHPLYLCGIMRLWFTPIMSAAHFVFAMLMLLTVYFFIGVLFEERDLRAAFKESYRVYDKDTCDDSFYKKKGEIN